MNNNWYDRAACLGAPASVFFPEGTENTAAKKICAQCPVQAECLEAGMGEKHGVWGGETERSRERIRKAKRAA